MRYLICSAIFAFHVINGLGAGPGPVSTETLLHEMTDRQAISQWPDPGYEIRMASSYDRRSVKPGKPGWFANGDQFQFERTDSVGGRKTYVLMDHRGPGAIVRFWLTTTRPAGRLRIYFDDHKIPDIDLPGWDLQLLKYPAGSELLIPHSSYVAGEKGGSTLYLPMPFEKRCVVTWEEPTGNQTAPRYYQINYRIYAPGTAVKTFRLADSSLLKPLLARVNAELKNTGAEQIISGLKGKKDSVFRSVGPGDSIALSFNAGQKGGAIEALRIQLPDLDTVYLKNHPHEIQIKMEFDGRTTVDCPLDDFIGAGPGWPLLLSRYRVVEAPAFISLWLMPYRSRARIILVNKSRDRWTAGIDGYTGAIPWTDHSLYFHATAEAAMNLSVVKTDSLSDAAIAGLKSGPQDWTMLETTGRGIYAGNTFETDNHLNSWYGEGDQKISVDNNPFPVEFGTGTEDYYNTSWAPVVLYQTPFANAPRADRPDSHGLNVFTRTRILDAVPFRTHFKMTWETLGWENGTVDLHTVVYWYGR